MENNNRRSGNSVADRRGSDTEADMGGGGLLWTGLEAEEAEEPHIMYDVEQARLIREEVDDEDDDDDDDQHGSSNVENIDNINGNNNDGNNPRYGYGDDAPIMEEYITHDDHDDNNNSDRDGYSSTSTDGAMVRGRRSSGDNINNISSSSTILNASVRYANADACNNNSNNNINSNQQELAAANSELSSELSSSNGSTISDDEDEDDDTTTVEEEVKGGWKKHYKWYIVIGVAVSVIAIAAAIIIKFLTQQSGVANNNNNNNNNVAGSNVADDDAIVTDDTLVPPPIEIQRQFTQELQLEEKRLLNEQEIELYEEQMEEYTRSFAHVGQLSFSSSNITTNCEVTDQVLKEESEVFSVQISFIMTYREYLVRYVPDLNTYLMPTIVYSRLQFLKFINPY